MEVGRLIVGFGFFGLAFGALAMFGNETPVMSVTEAELQPMGRGFALVAKIDNTGKPDRLIGIGSESAMQTNLMGGTTSSFPIPAGSTPSLAMDGAHAMLSGLQGGVEDGRLVPVTFWFENAGRVQTRARIVDQMTMDHGQTFDVPSGDTAPTLDLIVTQEKEDWLLSLATTN